MGIYKMSCLKNLLILIFVVGLLIYITEENKQKEQFSDKFDKEEDFSVVGSLLDSRIELSKKQINKLNSDLNSEESRNRLISELNSEVSSTQSIRTEIQPVEQEVNYAVIGRDNRNKSDSRPIVEEEEEVSSENKINQPKYSQYVEEELDRRVSYNTNKNRINQQIEEEESFKKYLFGKKVNNEEEMSEQESEYKIVPFVEEETSQIIKPEGPQLASKYALLSEEEQKRNTQKQYLEQEHKRVKNYEEEEMGINNL